MSRILLAGISASMVLLGGSPSPAQAPAAAPQTAQAAAPEADAMQALDRMGEALRAMKSFSVQADVTNEEVLTTGQKLQYSGTVDILARTPNKFLIKVDSERKSRDIYYDGKAVTLFAPKIGFYASFAAPGTIRETLDRAAENYGIEIPLADLFSWGKDPELVRRVQSGFRVGTDRIGDALCDHFAFRQENVDWEVWLRQGEQALPCKLVITSTDDPSMPQYTALLTWNPSQANADSVFAFTPPPNATKITFAEVSESASAK